MRHVQALLEDADAGAGGRARLRFAPVPPESRHAHLAVRRSDPATPWLGPNGWQVAEHRFLPLEAAFDGDALVLTVGREIVDAVPEFSVVELQLPEFGIASKVSWEGVIPSYGAFEPDPPRDSGPVRPPDMLVVPPGERPRSPPPAPVPVRSRPVRAAFVITPARLVVLRALDHDLKEPLPVPEPGEGLPGLPFAELAQAFRGTLRIETDGTARITGQDGMGPPRRLRFRATPGGGGVVQALDGHPFGAQIGPSEAQAGVFGLSHAALAAAGSGQLVLDPASLTATLVEDSLGHDPLPPIRPRRSLLVPALGVVALVCVGGATVLLW